MSLKDHRVRATVAVSDIDRAVEFYEGKLGLSGRMGGRQLRIYECGGGSELQVYESSDNAGKSPATVVSWSVPEFDSEIDELLAAGVEFARYDGLPTDDKGVHAFGDHKVVWFLDPDGNTIAIDNGGPI